MVEGSPVPVVVPGVDGALAGQLFAPPGHDRRPAVVVLPEIDGLDNGTLAAAGRLAAAGFVALALDLYAPYGGAPPLRSSAATTAWLERLDDRRQLSDLAGAVRWLGRRPGVDPGRLGAVGFSVGGRYAMLLASEPHGLGAVAAFYSRPWPGGSIAGRALAPGDHVLALRSPVYAVFGADDELIPPEMVKRFAGLLTDRPGGGHQVHVVPGRHYFANPCRTRRYDPDSAETAWAGVLAFLRSHLQTGSDGGAAHS